MIMQPAVLALLTGSLLVTVMTFYAALYGLKILKRWDLISGSEVQLELEKRTYLISTIISYAFGFQIFSFFLFIYTAEDLHRLFVGAMCAAGTLNVNGFGYPVLVLKIINFILAGLWLIINYTDNRAHDYPLIKIKYKLLLALTPFIAGETILQGAYFLNLKAHVITSCCGSLFSADAEGVASGIAALPVQPMMIAFFTVMLFTIATGVHFYSKMSKSGLLFSTFATVAFPVSVAALISFISCYFYEMPTHHCPFCILQREYGYAGYTLYTTLLGGAISGAGVGVLMPFSSIPSLRRVIPLLQKRMTGTSVILYSLMTLFVIHRIVFTDFRMIGY